MSIIGVKERMNIFPGRIIQAFINFAIQVQHIGTIARK